MNSLTLVGRRQTTAAAATHDACTANPSAGSRSRPQQRPAFEGGNCFTAQHTRQLDPFCAANARTALDQLCRHFRNRRPSALGLAVRHLPYCHPDLGTGSKTRCARNTRSGAGVVCSTERTVRTS